MAVYLDLAAGDTLLIGSTTRIRLERKSGGRARLRIESSQDVDHVKAGEPLPAEGKTASAPAPGPTKARPFLQRP